jgi:hypothetical protein
MKTKNLIQAHPNWFMALPVHQEDGTLKAHLDPIIAWQIDVEDGETLLPVPVTFGGMRFINGYHGIVRPDGGVYCAEYDCDDVAAFLASHEDRRQEARERHEKEAAE